MARPNPAAAKCRAHTPPVQVATPLRRQRRGRPQERRCNPCAGPPLDGGSASAVTPPASSAYSDSPDTEIAIRALRTIPLRQVVVDALHAMPARIDTPALFPTPRGGYIDLEKFRHRE